MRIVDYNVAGNMLQRARGIMFYKKNFKPLIFIFSRASVLQSTIHSFFCPPFDAVFLNENKEIIDLYEKVLPFKLSISPIKPAKYLIEAPEGFISKNNLKKGDFIEF